MLNTSLLLEPVQTPEVMSAKLLLPRGSGHDPIGARGAHQLLASLLTRGCGPHDHNAIADLIEGCGRAAQRNPRRWTADQPALLRR